MTEPRELNLFPVSFVPPPPLSSPSRPRLLIIYVKSLRWKLVPAVHVFFSPGSVLSTFHYEPLKLHYVRRRNEIRQSALCPDPSVRSTIEQ